MAGLLKRFYYRTRNRDSRGRISPSFEMITSEKSRGDSTWTNESCSEEPSPPTKAIAAMPEIEPLQEVPEAHTKA